MEGEWEKTKFSGNKKIQYFYFSVSGQSSLSLSLSLSLSMGSVFAQLRDWSGEQESFYVLKSRIDATIGEEMNYFLKCDLCWRATKTFTAYHDNWTLLCIDCEPKLLAPCAMAGDDHVCRKADPIYTCQCCDIQLCRREAHLYMYHMGRVKNLCGECFRAPSLLFRPRKTKPFQNQLHRRWILFLDDQHPITGFPTCLCTVIVEYIGTRRLCTNYESL